MMSTMARQLTVTLVILIGLLVINAQPVGGTKMIATKSEFHIPDFKEISFPEADADVNHIVTSYQSAITDLIDQLDGGKLLKAQQTYVIYFLGALLSVGSAMIRYVYIAV